MTPEQIERLLEAVEQINEAIHGLVTQATPDPYRDLKVFVLGLITALVAGWLSHWLTHRREGITRKVEEWERLKDWDEEGRKTDLRGTDLTPPWLWLRRRLPGRLATWLPAPRYLDLEEVNLGADKQYEKGVNLTRAKLPLVDLTDANLERANLRASNLENASLRYANLEAALLMEAKVKGARLESARLQEADLTDADLQGADLRQVNLQGANLRRANLQRANLQGANLKEAYLVAVEFQAADLQAANLQGAYLRGGELDKARWNDDTAWPEGYTPPTETIKV
jgi:uncharacterized protein YjbI with pentapeptide repeats